MDSDEFTKTRGVVIPHSLGITIGLQQRVGCNNLVLKGALHLARCWLRLLGSNSCNCCKVLDDTLGVDSLSCTGFSSNQDRLVLTICVHELIGIIRDGEDVRWCLNPLLASVSSHNYRIIYWKPLVGIHHNAKQPRVGVDHPGCKTLFEVIQHTGLVEVGHHGHVLNFIKLWRVPGKDFIFFHSECLTTVCFNCGFATLSLHKFTLEIHLLLFSHKEGGFGIKRSGLCFNPLLLWLPEVDGRWAIALHLRVCAHGGTLVETQLVPKNDEW